MKVAVLTGGKDVHYVLGLVPELASRGIRVVVAGNDELAHGAGLAPGRVESHDLVGRRDPSAGPVRKAWRVLSYYGRLLRFAYRTDARLFHILWFRKFPVLERVLLTSYFKALKKKIVFTAHNVDDQARDGSKTTLAQRLSLKFFYRTADHLFVHTEEMKRELVDRFRVAEHDVTVVPFGINEVIPASRLPRCDARGELGLGCDERVLLFFGNIAPYKGIEDLLRALAHLVHQNESLCLILAGRVKDRSCETYWAGLERLIDALQLTRYIRKEIRHIPDPEVGLLFRAADASVLPYRRVYQSGVVALSYAQGVPVIASDTGSFRSDVIEGQTGFLFRAGDPLDLANAVRAYFSSDLFADLEARRPEIRAHGASAFSWSRNGELTRAAYERVLAAELT
jgi:D-inositol-3-phosphate glycosyltransferase